MLKRLPYFILALFVGLWYTLGSTTEVRAASPIFYDGTVEFGIARRSFYDQVDFNYATQNYQLPLLNDFGIVDSNAWGLPSAFSGVTYNNIPMYVCVNCPDLALHGGYLYVSFMICRFNGTGISNFTATQANRGKVYQWSAGSLASAIANGTEYTSTILRTQNQTNTVLVNPEPASTGNEVIHVTELNLPSGVNFPSTAIFDLDDDKGTLNAYGLTDAYILGYSETADSNWIKSNVWTYKITVPPGNSNINSSFWWDFSNFISGNFTPVSFNNYNMQTNAGIYFIQSTLSGSQSNLVYLCPVTCFACTTESYLEVEQYLANISSQLSGITGDSVPQSVKESYAALGSQAREEAHQAAQAMQQVYPTYDPSAMDVSNLMDTTAKEQFNAILAPIWNNKILPIIGAVFTLVMIGFVFFGKK